MEILIVDGYEWAQLKFCLAVVYFSVSEQIPEQYFAMAPGRKETTTEERAIAVREFARGRTYGEIGEILQRSRETVRGIIRRYGKMDLCPTNQDLGAQKPFRVGKCEQLFKLLKETPEPAPPYQQATL